MEGMTVCVIRPVCSAMLTGVCIDGQYAPSSILQCIMAIDEGGRSATKWTASQLSFLYHTVPSTNANIQGPA